MTTTATPARSSNGWSRRSSTVSNRERTRDRRGNAMTIPAPPAGTRVFAILGNPVAHSLSPAIQNAALRAAGLDGRYVAIACQPEDVAPVMRTLARAGGGGNVTVPHKRRAAAALDDAAAAVGRTGACNTFWGEGARIRGDNTDVE
ncbi:MAG: hypothetical protein F4020_02005, partial [Gammaproteobacteria bacterium]|nr:hypothetical protein [Gammaproteobacteria bacterium]